MTYYFTHSLSSAISRLGVEMLIQHSSLKPLPDLLIAIFNPGFYGEATSSKSLLSDESIRRQKAPVTFACRVKEPQLVTLRVRVISHWLSRTKWVKKASFTDHWGLGIGHVTLRLTVVFIADAITDLPTHPPLEFRLYTVLVWMHKPCSFGSFSILVSVNCTVCFLVLQ